MSKRHGHRKHRRSKRQRRVYRTPADALIAVASALNYAEAAGVRIRFRHGVLWSDYGVILPLEKKEPWVARPFVADPLSPSEDQVGDGMDD